MMRPTTERRSITWYSCVQPTTWSWTQARPRRLLWSIGGPGELNMFLSAYMARRWNVWITLSSWSSTSFIWPVLVSEHLTSGKEAPTSSFFLRKLKHAGLSFQLRVNETCSWIQVLTFWLWKNYLIGPIAQPTEIKTAVFPHIYYHTILKSLSLQNFSLHLSQTSVWQKTSWCAKLFIGSFHKCTMFSGGQWDITWP